MSFPSRPGTQAHIQKTHTMHPNNILATAIRELVKTHGGFASGDEEEEIMDHHINQLGEG